MAGELRSRFGGVGMLGFVEKVDTSIPSHTYNSNGDSNSDILYVHYFLSRSGNCIMLLVWCGVVWCG